MKEDAEVESSLPPGTRAVHVKKRALRNKALSISFDEKDLNNYVTGFHKRKKKRRKEAQQQQQVVERRKRIEARKKRKQEKLFAIYGESGAPPDSTAKPDEGGENSEEDEDEEEEDPAASASGITMYDAGDVKVTVMTSEISHEDEDTSPRPIVGPFNPDGIPEKMKHKLPVATKKPFKKPQKRRSHPKPLNKRDKRKAKNQGKAKKHH